MDSALLVAKKLGIGSEYQKMIISGISELKRLDYVTSAYVEFLRESRITLLSSLFESKVAKGEYDRNLLISLTGQLIPLDSNR